MDSDRLAAFLQGDHGTVAGGVAAGGVVEHVGQRVFQFAVVGDRVSQVARWFEADWASGCRRRRARGRPYLVGERLYAQRVERRIEGQP